MKKEIKDLGKYLKNIQDLLEKEFPNMKVHYILSDKAVGPEEVDKILNKEKK